LIDLIGLESLMKHEPIFVQLPDHIDGIKFQSRRFRDPLAVPNCSRVSILDDAREIRPSERDASRMPGVNGAIKGWREGAVYVRPGDHHASQHPRHPPTSGSRMRDRSNVPPRWSFVGMRSDDIHLAVQCTCDLYPL